MLSSQQIYHQWLTYRPYLYDYYSQHQLSGFTQIYSAKWCTLKNDNNAKQIQSQKGSKKFSQNIKNLPNNNNEYNNFIIAGCSRFQAPVQKLSFHYEYSYVNYIIKCFQLKFIQQDQNIIQVQNKNQQNNEIIKEINIIMYEKPINCIQRIFLQEKKNSNDRKIHQIFLVALQNQSIRLISSQKFINRNASLPQTFHQKSPFLKKNIKNLNQYCLDNQYEIGLINFKQKINTLKHCRKRNNLLCACVDKSIVLIDLNVKSNNASGSQSINNSNTQIQHRVYLGHKGSVKDIVWLINFNSQEKYSFASISDDCSLLLWNVNNPHPINIIENVHHYPTSIIQIRPDQLITAGKDCFIKFWDLKKLRSYIFKQNTSIVTQLFNLTDEIQIKKDHNYKSTQIDHSLRFISCNQTGEVIFFNHQKQFQHLAHQDKLASIDYLKRKNIFIVIQSQKPKLSIFKPILSNFLQSSHKGQS